LPFQLGTALVAGIWLGQVRGLGQALGEVSSFTTTVTPPIPRVLYWPLDRFLPLHILTSWSSSLSDVGLLYELVLQSLVALHGSLGSLLELRSELLLRSTLDRSSTWHIYLGLGVVATLTLALLLPLAIHDTTVVL
jgi:hypothetical protein